MKRLIKIGLLFVLVVGYQTVAASQDIAQQAYLILEQNCFGCHGPHGAFTEQIVIDSAAGLIDSGALVPRNPLQSELYTRLDHPDPTKRMPLGGQLSEDAMATIRNWIQAGAPSWKSQHDVNFISTDAMLTVIQNHLNGLDTFDRPFARYFTTTHLYNAGEGPEALRAYQIALSKLVNSLSWGFQIINPEPIGAAETIFYIDLRNYEWDTREAWTQIETLYPYPMAFNAPAQGSLLLKLTYLRGEMDCEVPFVYADWFLATASLPPLYHDILALPETEQELERELRIDVARNLQSAPGVRVWRAGTNNSGVSNHNRVVERHTSPYGAYWKSHDFAGSAGPQNIFTHPLSFQRDGGEVIFNLPNGLQAYYIADGFGNRIDIAPTEIVSNPAASDPAVRNGLSCIGCHTEGMKDFEDEVRGTIERIENPNFDKDHALRLYVTNDVMTGLLEQDTARYRAALEATGGVFGGIEPVHRFYEEFQEALDAPHAAAAVGWETEAFLAEIQEKSSLQNLGLAGLLSGRTVKRDVWTSQFANIIAALNSPDTQIVPNPRVVVPPGSRTSGLIPDPNLYAVIAETLGKAPTDAITEPDLVRLTRIDADDRGITDLTGLEHATRLEHIELRHNTISDLSALAGLVRLNGIWLEGNPISDVSPLAGCFSLRGIDARDTALSDFSALAALPRFQWLIMNRSKLSDLSGLAELTKLTELHLVDNGIKDISPLAKLTGLKYLQLDTNRISDVSALAELTDLEHLYLAKNTISDVSPLAGLTGLKELDLDHNRISDFSPLVELAEKFYIQTSGNPGTLRQGGPKITGPWLWVVLPGLRFDDFSNNRDLLAGASGGDVTERQIATDGAGQGEPVGDSVWTASKISDIGSRNITEALRTLGIGPAPDKENAVYGSILLDSPREQETKMFAGSSTNHKVWLNGELVNEDYHNWREGYQAHFSVTLKQGRNVLLVSIHNWDGWLGGHFGFAPDTEYTVLPHGARFSLSTNLMPIRKGDSFTLRLNTANVMDLAGWQTDIAFDPKRLKVDGVSQGNFFKQDGTQTFFQKGTTQNKRGKITKIRAARAAKGGVDGDGTLLIVRLTALANGVTRLRLLNFKAGSSTGTPISSEPIEKLIVIGGQPAAPAFIPEITALHYNYPNPFNPETWIPYQLSKPADVTLTIYDIQGHVVRFLDFGHQDAGLYQDRSRAAHWDGRNTHGELVASGVYFYTLTAGDFTATRKMLILK